MMSRNWWSLRSCSSLTNGLSTDSAPAVRPSILIGTQRKLIGPPPSVVQPAGAVEEVGLVPQVAR